MGYGVIGNTQDSDSCIPGSSPGTPAISQNFLEILPFAIEFGMLKLNLTYVVMPVGEGGDLIYLIPIIRKRHSERRAIKLIAIWGGLNCIGKD